MSAVLVKALITGAIVALVSEIAKRSSLLAAVLASLPLTSILTFIWVYRESKDVEAVRNLSHGIFWMILPSLGFFWLLPALMKGGVRFYPSLLLSCAGMAGFYWIYVRILAALGVRF